MLKASLVRVNTSENGTFGNFTVSRGASSLSLCSMELPWRGNQHKISSIPVGKYDATFVKSPTKGKMLYRLTNVKGRDGILIHAGNSLLDTEGCILLGFSIIDNKLSKSAAAIELFHYFTAGEAIQITISEAY